MRIFPIALSILMISGCAEPSVIPREAMDVSGPVYRINVAAVNMTHDYVSPRRLPNVEHLADTTPAEAVRRWAGARLVAAGSMGTLEVDIKDASIIHKDVPKQKSGIEGWFTTEQTEEYDGTLEVELKIYNAQSPLPVAHLNVSAHQTLTLPDDAAPIDRERVYHEMTVDLMKTLKPQLDENISRYFSRYLM